MVNRLKSQTQNMLMAQLFYSSHGRILSSIRSSSGNALLPLLGIDVHSGNPSKKYKTEILFAFVRLQLYKDQIPMTIVTPSLTW